MYVLFSPQLTCRILDYRDEVLHSLESLPMPSAKLDLWQALKSKKKLKENKITWPLVYV